MVGAPELDHGRNRRRLDRRLHRRRPPVWWWRPSRGGWVEEALIAARRFHLRLPGGALGDPHHRAAAPGIVNSTHRHRHLRTFRPFARLTRGAARASGCATSFHGGARGGEGESAHHARARPAPQHTAKPCSSSKRHPVRRRHSSPRPLCPIFGLGTQPPNPSWGRMLNEAQTFLYHRAAPRGLSRPRHRAGGARSQPAGRRACAIASIRACGGRR